MDQLLTPVRTLYHRPDQDQELLLAPESQPQVQDRAPGSRPLAISSVEDALQALRAEPDHDALTSILRFLTTAAAGSSIPRIQVPGPTEGAVVQTLISDIVPNFWPLLRETLTDDGAGAGSSKATDAKLLLQCLRNVPGLNTIILHIKALVRESRHGDQLQRRPGLLLRLAPILQLLSTLLAGDGAVRALWEATKPGLDKDELRAARSGELVSLLSGGRTLAVAAEALALVGPEDAEAGVSWLANGADFTRWIGRNVASWARREPQEEEAAICSQLFQRAMSLGYADVLVKTLADDLLLSRAPSVPALVRVCFHEVQQKSAAVMNLFLGEIARRFLTNVRLDSGNDDPAVSAAAGVINAVLAAGGGTEKFNLIDWCTTFSGAGLGNGVGIRRAVVAVLAQDKEAISTVLLTSLARFGDSLYISHAPVLQQEAHAQVLLLSAAYVARLLPFKMVIVLRSSDYMSAVSNRIGSTNKRARFLGMAVAEALSSLSDSQFRKLNFEMEDADASEAEVLKSLCHVSDSIDSLHLASSTSPEEPLPGWSDPAPARDDGARVAQTARRRKKPVLSASTPMPKAIIEEINSSDEEDDLVAYPKDSDPEDSDDDATLVQRNKPKAPVYIRDLITFLRDSDDYEKQKLALQTAPLLIRRKAHHGSEVSSHAVELARLLVGLQDNFELADFTEQRQQAMVALVVAQPASMGPWFARTFFEGDYSLAQRIAVLTSLGLAAREVAGLEKSELQAAASFPSRRMPPKMEQYYLDPAEQQQHLSASEAAAQRLKALPPNALDSIAHSLGSSFLAPLAADAADAVSGPDGLKLDTVKARYKSASATRRTPVRAIPNTTATLLAQRFFSPLTAHFQLALNSPKPAVLNPLLLGLYLRTLGLVVHAAGPSTLALPQLTAELWDLLLAVRVHLLGHLGVTLAWLFALAVLLEVNEGDLRRLCEQQGRQLLETRESVAAILDHTRGDDGGEENEVKMMAAGVLIKLGETVDKYQAMLMGNMLNYQS